METVEESALLCVARKAKAGTNEAFEVETQE
jgi:hypothetical protein